MSREPEQTCWTLVREAAQGDPSARSAFSDAYLAVVRGYLEARWRGRFATEVEDAVQEVFLECFKVGGALERASPEAGNFRGLLFAVTRNVARRFESRVAPRAGEVPQETGWMNGVPSDDDGQETLFLRSWALALVQEATALHRQRANEDGLEGKRRIELLERRFGDDEPIRDIAAGWGVPAQDVHNAYRKARKEFYACLKEVVAFHEPSTADLDAACKTLLTQLE